MPPHGKSPTHVRKPRKKKAASGKSPAKGASSKAVPRPQSAQKRSTSAKEAPLVRSFSGSIRLQKLLAAAGFGSRRDAEQFIVDQRVTVNGHTAKLGDSADPVLDEIRMDGERLVSDKPVYWLLHKPRGVVTTLRDEEGRRTVMALLPPNLERVYPVGRLDRETSGLLLMTNDGDTAHALLHPSLGNEREYKVTVKGQIDDKAVGRLKKGIMLDEGKTAPVQVTNIRYDSEKETSSLSLTLVEGKKRQIRRSLLMLGFPVRRLVRVRMGPLRLGRLGVGESRALRSEERRGLLEHVEALRDGPRTRRRSSRASGHRSPKPATKAGSKPVSKGRSTQRTPSSKKGTRR